MVNKHYAVLRVKALVAPAGRYPATAGASGFHLVAHPADRSTVQPVAYDTTHTVSPVAVRYQVGKLLRREDNKCDRRWRSQKGRYHHNLTRTNRASGDVPVGPGAILPHRRDQEMSYQTRV